MDSFILDETELFISKIRSTDTYHQYDMQVRKIQMYPELMEQINKYRQENFVMQNSFEGDELFDKIEEFNLRYESFLENPLVNDFLSAENALVKMMQKINTRIIEGLEFKV